ncbi:MAG TPA: nucleotidyltransferase family protein [Patescibacteria group bacterium]|nr:nucleotidyltransferase family protein [Patescibacteria group bacterium]
MKKGDLIQGVSSIKTFGGSMLPFLRDEDIVYFKRENFNNVKVNDIICVRKGGKIFTHRVVYKNEKFLITKGDNNYISDGKIYPKNVIGLVYKVKRDGLIFGINDLYLIQSTLYFQEIVKIKKAFKKANLDLIFLKGLPIYLYFDRIQPKRIYADCDILVSEKKLATAEAILKQVGYQREDPYSEYSIIKHQKEVSYRKIVNGFPVFFDLHSELVFVMSRIGNLNLLYPEELIKELTEKFVNERQVIKVNNENFNILSNENLLIYLCLHLFHHNFKGPHRYDLIMRILNQKLDYGYIVRVVHQFNLANFISPCLLILSDLYNSKESRVLVDLIGGRNNMWLNVDIFKSDDLPGSGAFFKSLLFLSPSPLWKKMMVFGNLNVLNSIVLVLCRKLLTQGLLGNYPLKQ